MWKNVIKVIKSSCCVFVPLSDSVLLSLLVYSDNPARHLESIKKVKEMSSKEIIEKFIYESLYLDGYSDFS